MDQSEMGNFAVQNIASETATPEFRETEVVRTGCPSYSDGS